MQRKLLRLLQYPIPGTEGLGRNLFKCLQWGLSIVIGLLILWIIGGNLLAAQQEKRVDQAIEQYIQQFPRTEANNSALKLEELGTNLGLDNFLSSTKPTRYLHLPALKANQKTFQDIKQSLSNYLDRQLDQPNEDIDPPPEDIRQYLADHTAELEAIRTYILNNEFPRWEVDTSRVGDINAEQPAFINSATFQKFLMADILDKTRQGQSQAALKTLEVSWKLNQALLERPEYIAQWFAMNYSQSQAVVMRKMQGLPTEWQDRLIRLNQYNLPQAFLQGLYSEAFLSVSARKYSATYFFDRAEVFSVDLPQFIDLPQWLGLLLDPLLKPYIRLLAVDNFDRIRQLVLKLPEQDFCSFNPDAFPNAAWWNTTDMSSYWASQWRKVGKTVLRFELTQKVLRVKELAQKQGSLPKQVPGIESSVCRDARWVYQRATDGTASISFSKDLEWMKPTTPQQKIPGDLLKFNIAMKQDSPTSATLK